MSILLVVAAYLAGSMPFAFLFARREGHPDIRLAGSGNVGATNVFQVVGSTAGVLTALLDVAKGAAVIVVAQSLGFGAAACAAAGVAVVTGHVYPVWLGFRGGKGVATTCGAFGVLAPLAMLPAVGVFAVAVALSRTVSLGSILAAACLAPLAYIVGAPAPVVGGAAVAACLVLLNHRRNIIRLAGGAGARPSVGTDRRGDQP